MILYSVDCIDKKLLVMNIRTGSVSLHSERWIIPLSQGPSYKYLDRQPNVQIIFSTHLAWVVGVCCEGKAMLQNVKYK